MEHRALEKDCAEIGEIIAEDTLSTDYEIMNEDRTVKLGL